MSARSGSPASSAVRATPRGEPGANRQTRLGRGFEYEGHPFRIVHHLEQDEIAAFLDQKFGEFFQRISHGAEGRPIEMGGTRRSLHDGSPVR